MTARSAASRLSTTALIAIATVAILVLGGLGVLIGKSAESDAKFPPPVPSPSRGISSLEAGARDTVMASRSYAAGGGPTDSPTTDSVTLGDGVVTVPVPEGWDADVVEEGSPAVYLSTPGFEVYVNVYKPKQRPDPVIAVADAFNDWVLQDDDLSQVENGDVKLDPDVEGLAYLRYSALLADSSGSVAIVGELDGFVRGDGWVLLIQVQAGGATVDDAIESFKNESALSEVFGGTAESFLNG